MAASPSKLARWCRGMKGNFGLDPGGYTMHQLSFSLCLRLNNRFQCVSAVGHCLVDWNFCRLQQETPTCFFVFPASLHKLRVYICFPLAR